MIENGSNIAGCNIPDSVNFGQMLTLLNTQLGENCMVGSFSKMAYSRMGDFSYIGDYTVVINASIGKFSSISWGVTVGPEEHDYTKVTNHSFLYSLKSFKLTSQKYYSPFEKDCTVGSDVWIGCNSTILRGVKIGDGAVIGANSLVNKDVPPYAIVVGSPAKIIKYRFDRDIIDGLIKLNWWDIAPSVISENAELFSATPTHSVIKKIEQLKQRNNSN